MKPKDVNLKNLTETEILVHSKTLSEKTNAEIADGMNSGEETVARMLRCPREGEYHYGLRIGKVRGWNRATGNKVVLQWLCQQEGGVFVEIQENTTKEAVAESVGRVNKEGAEVIARLIGALRDGVLSTDEREWIEKELMDLFEAVEGALLSVRGRMAL